MHACTNNSALPERIYLAAQSVEDNVAQRSDIVDTGVTLYLNRLLPTTLHVVLRGNSQSADSHPQGDDLSPQRLKASFRFVQLSLTTRLNQCLILS